MCRRDAMKLLTRQSLQQEIFGGQQFAMISISCVKDGTDVILGQTTKDLDQSTEMISLHTSHAQEMVPKFLPLWFLDIIPRQDDHRLDDYLMTEEQAKQIVDFIEETKDMPLVVHCTAGISRSGAVGAYASIARGEEDEFWKAHERYIHPNVHVLSLLKRHLYQGE